MISIVNIISILMGFILLCQTFIILIYMCTRRRINRHLYRNWNNYVNEKERKEDDEGFYV